MDNASIAELLVREAQKAEGHRELAFRRAARAAFMWPLEASELAEGGGSLVQLAGIGPSLARRLEEWLLRPPPDVRPPLIRRDFLTLAKARRLLAKNPRWTERVKGDLQMHTEWSDGASAIAEMAAGGIARHYEYIAITDHTKGLKIAGGLDEKRLARQGREIDALNKHLRKQGTEFTVLRSAEVNLSPAGEGDMNPKALAKLDLVLGCFHSVLRRTDDQTDRYIAALRNPSIQILGHPQTRMYDRRDGLHCDWNRVFAEGARLGKAVEIDGDPNRQPQSEPLKVGAGGRSENISGNRRTSSGRVCLYGTEPRRGLCGQDSSRANHQLYAFARGNGVDRNAATANLSPGEKLHS